MVFRKFDSDGRKKYKVRRKSYNVKHDSWIEEEDANGALRHFKD